MLVNQEPWMAGSETQTTSCPSMVLRGLNVALAVMCVCVGGEGVQGPIISGPDFFTVSVENRKVP